MKRLNKPFLFFMISCSQEQIEGIVKTTKLELDGTTGDKKDVHAFLVSYKGHPQIHFKYGHKFYRFNLIEANEKQQMYNGVHNIR